MSKIKRIIIVFTLLTGFTAFSFGESFYSLTTGLYRFSETYLDEAYGRELDGLNVNFSLTYFPQKFFLGFFLQTSFQGFINGYEWGDTAAMKNLESTIYDIRFYMAPSARLKLGNKLRIPLSLGLVVPLFREESWSSSNFYEVIGMGLFLDAALVFNPSRWFFLRHGFTVEWDFLHAERGIMDSQLRNFQTIRYSVPSYAAFFGSIYFGIGIRIE